MNFRGAAESVGASFGKTGGAGLAFVFYLGPRPDSFFDGSFGVDAVLVVEIDRVDAETAETAFAGLADVVGLAADAASGGILGIADDTEFRGEDDFVALAVDGVSDELFVGVRSVGVGSVEEIDAEFESAVNRGNGFGVVASGIKLGHAHAA